MRKEMDDKENTRENSKGEQGGASAENWLH